MKFTSWTNGTSNVTIIIIKFDRSSSNARVTCHITTGGLEMKALKDTRILGMPLAFYLVLTAATC